MWPKTKSYAQKDLHDHHISITATAIQEAVRPPRGETPGTGFLIAIAKVEFWHQKVKRVVCIRKIISFWRTYKRNRRATRSTSASLSINWKMTARGIIESENIIFKAVQRYHSEEEERLLIENAVNQPDGRWEMKKSSSKLAALNPFVSADGLIRVGSRLINSSLDD